MYLYDRIVGAIQKKFRRRFKRNFFLDIDTLQAVKIIAAEEKRDPEEVAGQMLISVIRGRQDQVENRDHWIKLSPREQDVTALICLNYTTRQIAAKLLLSPETVKTYAERVLMKFDVHNRNELRKKLKDWDFEEWEQ